MEENEISITDESDIKRVLESIVSVEYEHYDSYNGGTEELYEDEVDDFKEMVLREVHSKAKYVRTLIYDKLADEFRWAYHGADDKDCWIVRVSESFSLDQIQLL